MPPAVLAQRRPERLVDDLAEAVGGQERPRGVQSVQGADLGQRERARLQRADPPGEAVASPFDAQRRAPGDHRAHGRVVDQGLQLHVPAGDGLHLVEEKMRPPPGLRQPVEMRAGDVVLEPVCDAQDRIDEVGQRSQIVELHPEDRVRPRAFREQVLDDLELRRGLADLPRAAHRHDRRQREIEPPADPPDQIPARSGLHGRRIAAPPGVLPAQVGDERPGQLRDGERRAGVVHGSRADSGGIRIQDVAEAGFGRDVKPGQRSRTTSSRSCRRLAVAVLVRNRSMPLSS